MVVSQGLSSGRSYEKVARFKLIWWDKGSGSKDGVSIWHPIVSPGCAMLGDLAVQGLPFFCSFFFNLMPFCCIFFVLGCGDTSKKVQCFGVLSRFASLL